MYALLNQNIDLLCSNIEPARDIRPYVQLTETLRKVDVSADRDFQRTYRKYWQLNAALLGNQFVGAYFTYFEELKQANDVTLERVVRDLFEVPTHGDGRQSLQFSFASKMVHMLRPRLPLYDSMVEAFFFLPLGSPKEKTEVRLQRLLASYGFLVAEYDRVLREGLLAPAIATFRARFRVGGDYTDEKIVDTLIWGFVRFVRAGAIRDRAILYR